MKTTALLVLTTVLLIGGTGCETISDSLKPPPAHGYERFVYDQNLRNTYRSPASEELGALVEKTLFTPILVFQTAFAFHPYVFFTQPWSNGLPWSNDP